MTDQATAPERTRYFNPKDIQFVQECFGKKGRFNPRTLRNPGFTAEKMEVLRNGIAKDGLNHALLVRVDPKTDKPRLVAGERRLRAIMGLLELDEEAVKLIKKGEKDTRRVLVKNPKTGKMEPALDVFTKVGVECKITDETDEREVLRQAIQENTLHEGLTDYELLLQCENMEKAGFSRKEQAETLDMSEAWVSQSHSLLSGPRCILDAMEENKLTRTAAVTFLPIPPEKVAAVLKRAIDLTYQAAEHKAIEAEGELKEAVAELEQGEKMLRLSQFTGDQESQRKARRVVARAGVAKKKAEAKLETAQEKKKNKKVSVETIAQVAQEIEGAGDDLHKPMSMKMIRQISTDLAALLASTDEEDIENPGNGHTYSRRDITLVLGVVDCFLCKNDLKHPLDAILAADGLAVG